MAQDSLLNYIRTQVSSGQRLDYITSILLQQGFSQQQIDEAYAQLKYTTSNQQTTPAVPTQTPQKNFLPIVIIVLALFVLLILGTFAFSNKKIKSTLTSSYPTTTFQSTHAISQTLPDCSDSSRWIVTSGTSFNATTYLKPVSVNTCEYTDSILGYTVQYPANWYINFNPSHPAQQNYATPAITGITGNNGTAQSYNFISFVPQQLAATNNSPQAVSIYIISSKTNYSDIISYMESIQMSPGNSYEPLIEKNVYQPINLAGQKAIQMQYAVGTNVGIDTKFIFNGVLYDVTFNGTSLNAINANKKYYTNFLNSFTLKPIQ